MFYLIKSTLEERKNLKPRDSKEKYVAILSAEEWQSNSSKFDMGIDLEVSTFQIDSTKAEVNYDSLTGTFCLPDRNDISGENRRFAFALDEKGIVFIDDSGAVSEIISGIVKTKRWTKPYITTRTCWRSTTRSLTRWRTRYLQARRRTIPSASAR